MQILSAKRVGTRFSFHGDKTERFSEPVKEGQIKKDMMILKRMHSKALLEESTWKYFGGILKVGDRQYQVCE